MKTIQDFQQKAKEKDIKKVPVHNCSMCDYLCGYIIRGEEVFYDNGCGCVWGGERPSSWQEIADDYNRNQRENNKDISQEWLDKTDKFWGFIN